MSRATRHRCGRICRDKGRCIFEGGRACTKCGDTRTIIPKMHVATEAGYYVCVNRAACALRRAKQERAV